MLVGALTVDVIILLGKADVLFTSYVPLKAHPLFYLGIILFAVGALIAVLLFFATLFIAKRDKTYEGSVPLVTFGAMTAAIIAVITLLHGAAIYIPTFLWSLGIGERRSAGLPHDLVGPRPHLAADQRRRHGRRSGTCSARSPSAQCRSTRRSAAAPSCSTSCSSPWPRPTTCWSIRASARPGRSGTPATRCTSRCSPR